MDVFERVTPCTPHDHALPILFPLENGAGTDAEFPANLGWNGDLTLGGDFGLRQRHDIHITTVIEARRWNDT